jgi:L-lactate dehydrogenase complex protein LldG
VVAVAAMNARDEILARIERALRDVPPGERPADVVVRRGYVRAEAADAVERFVERIAEYRTTVVRVPVVEVAAAVAERLRARGASRVAIPQGLPPEWLPEEIEAVSENDLDPEGLERVDCALTGCALAIAETGTIVLDTGPGQGRRALTLVPDHHVCVMLEDQIVGGVPEAMALVSETLRRERRPVTFVSGPSATSDIELSRVEGVHGPRTLDVIVAAA